MEGQIIKKEDYEKQKIESQKIREYGRYKKRELLHFGVDYLKAYITFEKKPKIKRLGLNKNSDIYFYDDNTFFELAPLEEFPKFEFYITIRDKETNVKLAFILMKKYKKIGAININNIFEVTGQGLILRNVKFYFNLIKWAGFTIEKFKEVHICFDLAIDVGYINDKVVNKFIEGKTIEPIIKKGKLETLYIGERNTRKNTYQLIRIYNKVKDTFDKKKNFLYGFDKKQEVTRFEVELRRDKARFITEKKLLDDDYIFSVIYKTFYKMNFQYFKFLHFEDFKRLSLNDENLKKERIKAISKRNLDFLKYGNDFKNDTDKNRTLALFLNAGKRLFKNGYSYTKLTKIMQENGIFDEKT